MIEREQTSGEKIRAYLEANEGEFTIEVMRRELVKAGYDAADVDAAWAEQEAELRQAYIDSKVSIIEQTIAAGRTAYLHFSVYVPVDSELNNEVLGSFDIKQLEGLGFEGWEIVATIPRTIGTGLTNKSYGSTFGETWGAGMGGNVAGVHVVLSYSINAENLEASRDVILMMVGAQYDRQFAG